jgi:CRP/FNR family transcriptional regulator, cyclic AMP receptor protein
MTLQDLFSSSELDRQNLTFGAGERVYEPHDSANCVYYIRSGEVRTFQVGDDGDGRLLEILGPGEWFNPAAFSSGQVCGHRAVSVGQTVLVRVSADKLLGVLASNGQAAGVLLRQFADRLQKAREDAAHLVFDDCNTRLIRTLLQLSQTVAATPRADGVELRITHLQLAQAVGAARETVSLALTDLRKQNLLRTGRNKLFFDPRALRDLQDEKPRTATPSIN